MHYETKACKPRTIVWVKFSFTVDYVGDDQEEMISRMDLKLQKTLLEHLLE